MHFPPLMVPRGVIPKPVLLLSYDHTITVKVKAEQLLEGHVSTADLCSSQLGALLCF